ncbi:MAG TPA: CoA protein activase [bacterium]|nr:CoA protein activase [bacterium]
MNITTPRMGLCHLGYRRFLEGFGHRVFIPPPTTKHTLSLGTRYSPEFVCFPFKIITGQYFQALAQHPEIQAIFTSGGRGPCRAGLYGVLHRQILAEHGHPLELYLLEPPVIANIKRMSPGMTWAERITQTVYAWRLLKVVEEIERLSHFYRPRELHPGSTDQAMALALARVAKIPTIHRYDDLVECIGRFFSHHVPTRRDFEPLRVGIVGEIFVVLDAFANCDVERTLGYLGVEVHRSLYVTKWLLGGIYRRWTKHRIARASRLFLEFWVGGDGRESVGESVIYAREGFDGVIQLSPFTCIPEIVAKSILPRIGAQTGMAVLSLDIDESTGRAGLQTRLEAFVDMLWRKRPAERPAAVSRARVAENPV